VLLLSLGLRAAIIFRHQLFLLSPCISLIASDERHLKHPKGNDGYAGERDRKIGMPENDPVVQRVNRFL
jgi:hypothetical protein